MPMARRSLQVVAFLCTLIVGAASMVVVVSQTAWFKEWLRGFIVRQAEDYVNGRLSIGRLDGNLFFGIDLEDVDVTQNGRTVVGIKDVGLNYNALSLIGERIVLDSIELREPTLLVEKTASGWNLAQLIKARTPDPDEPKDRRPLEIGEIGVSGGRLLLEGEIAPASNVELPSRIEGLDASLGVRSDEDELEVSIRSASLRAAEPSLDLQALEGVVRRTANSIAFEDVTVKTAGTSLHADGTVANIESGTPTVDIAVESERFDVREAARLSPALRGYDVAPAFSLRARGPLDAMRVDADVRDEKTGRLEARLTVDAEAPVQRVAGEVTAEHLDLAPIARRPDFTSDITGRGRIDLALPEGRRPLSGTFEVTSSDATVSGYRARNVKASGRIDGSMIRLNASSADAYGGRMTARGTVTAGPRLAVDLAGTASDIDLQQLPASLGAPSAPSDLQFSYSLNVRNQVVSGDVNLRPSTLAGARIGDGTVARFRVGPGAPAYAAKGTIADLDLQQIGRAFRIEALAADRYRSEINGTFDVSGAGGGRYRLTLDATGTATDSTLFGATVPRLDFTAAVGDGDVRATAIGQFAGFDPAVASGDGRFKGQAAGALNVSVAIRGIDDGVSAGDVDVAGRINLANSTIAGLAVDTGVIEGRFAAGEGELTQATITGPDVNLQAHGPLALNQTGSSDLTLHADTASLQRLGELVGQPIKGAAVVDATLTGNARALTIEGTLKGSDISYRDNTALALDTMFDATIPNLTIADASVTTTSQATFLEAAGQQINELRLDAAYAMNHVEFTGVAKQQAREIAAGGAVVLHPDHQEVHVRNLTLRTEGVEWATTPGGEAVVQYGADRVEVNDLTLVNGDQRIQASGVLGTGSDQLRVTLENVDVAQIDALLLGDQRVGGRLSATATVTGPIAGPRVAGEFRLSSGSFREFMFDSLAGTVDYADKGMTLDVRLQQDPQSWLTAKGYAPLTLFRPNPPEMVGAHDTPVAPANRVDIEVASSQIDLGVIQGFTSYVTNVTGSMQANVRVTGSGFDPHLEGSVEIAGGAFTAPDLGTSFRGLDTTIQLKPDEITIAKMQVLDEHDQPLTVGGTLGVHERAVGAVNIALQSDEFEVMHNEVGRLKLDTDLRLTGELREPILEGSVDVHTGTINIGQVLDRIGASPYSTSAENLGQPAASAEPSLLRTLALRVGIGIPSNLVLNGQNVRPANSPIEVGNMSITVGGAVQLQKAAGDDAFRLTGEVNTVRGNYAFQGRRFEIERDGRIRFQGGEAIDPLLDIRANRVISGVQTFVRIQGTMRQPELSLSSNPPLDEAEILSLIVFNQPINQLGEGVQLSLAERAATLAGGYLASGLTTSIRNALSLDEFEIQAAGDFGGGPQLTVGEQVGDNVFFRVRQGFGAAEATEVILEYQIREFLRLQATAAETQGTSQRTAFRRVERGGLDLIFFFSY